MPCCLNHKTSLSLGHKAAPEGRFKRKSCLTEFLTEGLQHPFALQPFWDHPWYSLFQQGMVSLSAVGFAVLVHSLFPDGVHNVELKPSVFGM